MDFSTREEFRQYLESSGVIDGLTRAFIKLYEAEEKPTDPLMFVQQNMSEINPMEKYQLTLNNLTAANKRIKSLEKMLNLNEGAQPLDFEQKFTAMHESNECNSLLKKYLTQEIFDMLKGKETSVGSTLSDCIRSGLENLDSHMGIYAADLECYTVFADIFNPIIEDYHEEKVQPAEDWGSADALENLDPENKYIVSTRVRCARSIEGFPFHPKMTEEQYQTLMEQAKGALEGLEGDNKGTFYALADMTAEEKKKMIDEHYLFKEGDRFLESAGALKFWPTGRAIFLNDKKTFLVWVNEEDHLRLISMQPGGDLGTIYKRLMECTQFLSERLKFARHESLGWMTFCPSNLGTTIRASVHIRLPELGKDLDALTKIAEEHHLQVRGTSGEHTESEAGVFDISNKRRLGLTEWGAVEEMHKGIASLIAKEQSMTVSE